MSSDRTIDPQQGRTPGPAKLPLSDAARLAAAGLGSPGGAPLRLAIADTAAALAADLATGNPILSQIGGMADSITLTSAGGTLTAIGLSAIAAIAGLDAGDILVPVADSAAAIAALPDGARALAGRIFVSDSAANVAGALSALRPFSGAPLTMTLAGISPALTVTAEAYQADHAIIDTITNAGCVTVTGDAASVAAIAPLLARDPRVLQVQVTDEAAQVAHHLGAIQPLGGALTVTLRGAGPIPVSVALPLVTSGLTQLSPGAVHVVDDGTALAALARAGMAARQFLATQGAILAHDSAVTLADAVSLAGLRGAFSRGGHRLAVWECAAALIEPGAAATLAALTASGLVSALHVDRAGAPLTLAVGEAASLLALPGLTIDNPDTSVNVLTVADSAERLAAAAPHLMRHRRAIAHVVVLANATISGATLHSLQAAGAVTAAGVQVTVSDTARNILAAASVHGASLHASAWALSAPATLSASEMLALAAVPGLTAGPHPLTVALPKDSPVTVAQANQLAALAGTLRLRDTGHHFTLHATPQTLTGLSAAAAGIVRIVPPGPDDTTPRRPDKHGTAPAGAITDSHAASAASPHAVAGAVLGSAHLTGNHGAGAPGAPVAIAAGIALAAPSSAGSQQSRTAHAAIDTHVFAGRQSPRRAAPPRPTPNAAFPERLLRLSQTPHFLGGSVPSPDQPSPGPPISWAGGTEQQVGRPIPGTDLPCAHPLLQAEVAALQAEDWSVPTQAIAAVLVRNGLAGPGNRLSVSATGMKGAAVNIYDAAGALLSSTQESNASFTIAAPGNSAGAGFSLTESVAGVESAPVVVIDAGTLLRAVARAGSNLADSGQILVEPGHYIDLYPVGARLPNHPALVYDPVSHGIRLAVPGAELFTLITLATSPPAALEAREILVKQTA